MEQSLNFEFDIDELEDEDQLVLPYTIKESTQAMNSILVADSKSLGTWTEDISDALHSPVFEHLRYRAD